MCRVKAAQFVEEGTLPNIKLPADVTSSNDASTEHWSGSDDGESPLVYSHQPYSADTLAVPQTPLVLVNSPSTSHAPSTAHVTVETSPAPVVPTNVEASQAPRRTMKAWPVIPTDFIPCCHEMETFPAGFTVKTYDRGLTGFFEVPSEWVVPTHGSIRFIEHYNEVGPYSRFRFQLCHSFLSGRCTRGFDCTYIHAAQLPVPQEIHVQGVDIYERLPAGVTFFIHIPSALKKPQMIPSEYIIRTEGSDRLFTDIVEGRRRSMNRPQHCAHFQFKKVCNLGANCSFIHSLVPAPREAQ